MINAKLDTKGAVIYSLDVSVGDLICVKRCGTAYIYLGRLGHLYKGAGSSIPIEGAWRLDGTYVELPWSTEIEILSRCDGAMG